MGAHFGEKTLDAARQNPALMVYAFEPNLELAARSFGVLQNFVVLPLAVCETDGVAHFHLNEFEAASSLLPFNDEGKARWIGGEQLRVKKVVSVPAIRLDTFMNRTGIRRVDFLKIDAQGADLDVVRSAGARVSDIRRVEMEVQVTPTELYAGAATKAAAVSYMTGVGFELVETVPQCHGQEENLTFHRATRPG
ncbi:MAG: methyltransferase FkbM family [Gemmataceae bacterium]|nr:methyltransferase FkbM family [Gemmataceae bacterium]